MKKIIAVLLALLTCVAAFAADDSNVDAFVEKLAQLKSYEEGQNRALRNELQLRIVEVAKDPAARARVAEALAALLQDAQATTAARQFSCRQLQTLGTEAQVPLLTKLLADADLADLARGALERIPGDASLRALRGGLSTKRAHVLVGVINSLGLRRDGASVAPLVELTDSTDAETVAAALTALGRIATPGAAEALLKARATAPVLAALHDAQLRCAERLVDAGNGEVAAKIYRHVWSSDRPTAWRLAALAGLARVSGEEAAPMVLDALTSDDPHGQAMAMNLARQLPGAKLTEALAQRLSQLAPAGQTLLLDVLAERGDPAAAETVRKLGESTDETVRSAVYRTMARLGRAESVAWFTQRAAAEKGALQQAAREALAKLTAEGVNERLLELVVDGETGPRTEAIRALAARQVPVATALLLKQAEETHSGLRTAALQALATLAGPEAYAPLLRRVIELSSEDGAAAEEALLAVAARIATPAERTAPVIAALKDAAPPVRVALLRVLGSLGGTEALAAIRTQLGDGDAAVRDGAVRALAGSTDAAAAPDLLQLAQNAESPVHRVLALRGYLRLIAATGDANARMKMLNNVHPLATTTDIKKMLLASLGDVPHAGALSMAAGFLEDKDVGTEAAMAVLKIGQALVKQDRTAVATAMAAMIERVQDAGLQARAKELLAQAKTGGTREKNALQPTGQESGDVRAEKTSQAPPGFRLVSYLDCGPETADGIKDGPNLRLASGRSYTWDKAESAAPTRFGSVAYDGTQVIFDASGLSPEKQYRLGFSWWDYDHNDRAQSVWIATGKGERNAQVLKKTALPSYAANKAKPAELAVDLPRELHADGRLRVSFRKEGGQNVVVSEVWLWESGVDGETPAGTQAAASEPTATAAVTAAPTNANAEARVLILTGNEYPGHKWKETAPALLELLRKDTRLDVQVIEDPNYLASPDLKKFNVIVLNYMNWKTPDPGEAARTNLKEAVEGGTGLVMVHFACGAFQGWPEFTKIAGRAWNPKLRGHDPFGKFTVQIAKPDHPIMKGLEAFETTDELYTCLDGEAPVEVIAQATSKVDKKDYPMAFVLQYGKGRVFHCVLGHDVQAIVNPPVAELYRRGTAWAAGLK